VFWPWWDRVALYSYLSSRNSRTHAFLFDIGEAVTTRKANEKTSAAPLSTSGTQSPHCSKSLFTNDTNVCVYSLGKHVSVVDNGGSQSSRTRWAMVFNSGHDKRPNNSCAVCRTSMRRRPNTDGAPRLAQAGFRDCLSLRRVLDWQPRLRGVGFGLLRTISSGRIVPGMDELPQPAHDSHQAHVDR
jgi:hypothetical protein